MNRLKISLTFIIMMGVLTCFIYWYVSGGQEEDKKRITMVQNGYEYGRGLITKMFYYKGHSIHVSYKINGFSYEHEGGWDDSKGFSTGDSITFKYALKDPSKIITELEDEYKQK